IIQEPDIIVAQLAGGDRADADVHLLIADDLCPELEQRPAAGDGEVAAASAKGGVEREIQIQRRGVELDVETIANRERAVDGADGVGTCRPGLAVSVLINS